MSTGNKKVNIFLKKFLTQQHITENFLDYLHNLILENHVKLVPDSGVYTYPVIGRSDTVDTIDILTPGETDPADGNGPKLEGDDGHGRILKLDDEYRENVPVPNELGIQYFVGARFNYHPTETEINVRTGVIKWSLFKESIGESGEPNVVSYYNNVFTMQVDSISNSVDQIGRKIRAWLKTPVSQASGDTYEEVFIIPQSIDFEHDGGVNYLDVANELAGYFQLGQSLTIDKSPTAPTTTTITLVGADDSGGTGFTRISVGDDLTSYTVAANSFVKTGNNIISLTGTLGQGITPSIIETDYDIFLHGLTVTTLDLRNNEYYVYLFNYTGAGTGNNPTAFDNSDQVQVPENLTSLLSSLIAFKKYQLQRNGLIFRGGGQFKFESGTLDWNLDFQIVNPFRGTYKLAPNSIGSIVTDDILYSKIWKDQPIIIGGNASGEIWIEDTTDFNDGDEVLVGDNDTNKVIGFVNGAPGAEKLTIVDGGMSPIDLSNYTPIKGGWIQRVNIDLLKGQINQGDLRPSINGTINEDVLIIAINQNNVLVFKNGVLKLEDGDVGEISNLPNSFNWINTLTELTDSITKTIDDSIGIIAPKEYTATAKIVFNKNLAWVGLTEKTVIKGVLSDPLLEVTYDATTTSSYMEAVFKGLTLQNTGTGHVLQIDNTGATKGMHIILDSCVLLASSGLTINVIHAVAGQWIKVDFIDSRNNICQGSIVFQSKNNGDVLHVENVKFQPNDYITIGESSADPSSIHTIKGCTIDQINAVGTGVAKEINVIDSYSWGFTKKIDINGQSSAIFKVSQVITDLKDFSNYQKADNGVIFRGGGDTDFVTASDEMVWQEPFEIVNPFYGLSIIDAGSLTSIALNEVLYTKLWKHHVATVDGNASGEITVKETTEFNDNDIVILGDEDSVKISGYVFGAPAAGVITVDDGAGTPIDLSSLITTKGAWIKRVNIDMLKSAVNVGDLKPDALGEIDDEIFIIGIRSGNTIVLKNGETIKKKWIYEESIFVDTPIDIGDSIFLPADSRNSMAPKTYQIGSGTLEFYINGLMQYSDQRTIESAFDPDGYTSGTGIVTVPDGVDLSHVRREDIFRDANNAEFSILGGIININGSKQFIINTGETVDLTTGAIIFRQDYIEPGTLHDWTNVITSRKQISDNAKYTFRIIPIDKSALSPYGSPSAGNTLQESYNNGNTITVISGTPIIISGPAGEKLLRILGDLEVTGVIDPKGLTFTREGAKPFGSLDGLWVDAEGRLNYFNKVVGENSFVDDFTDTSRRFYINPIASVMFKGRVVTKSGTGNMQYADWNTDDLSKVIGILLEDAGEDDSREVRKSGYVEAGIITSSSFTEASLPADRSRVWLHASGKMTITPPSGGSGMREVILGIWDDEGLNLQITFLGIA